MIIQTNTPIISEKQAKEQGLKTIQCKKAREYRLFYVPEWNFYAPQWNKIHSIKNTVKLNNKT